MASRFESTKPPAGHSGLPRGMKGKGEAVKRAIKPEKLTSRALSAKKAVSCCVRGAEMAWNEAQNAIAGLLSSIETGVADVGNEVLALVPAGLRVPEVGPASPYPRIIRIPKTSSALALGAVAILGTELLDSIAARTESVNALSAALEVLVQVRTKVRDRQQDGCEQCVRRSVWRQSPDHRVKVGEFAGRPVRKRR